MTVFVVGAIAVGSMQGAKANRLARVRARAAVATGADALQAIIDRGRQRGVLDDRPIDELLGYDQVGLPS